MKSWLEDGLEFWHKGEIKKLQEWTETKLRWITKMLQVVEWLRNWLKEWLEYWLEFWPKVEVDKETTRMNWETKIEVNHGDVTIGKWLIKWLIERLDVGLCLKDMIEGIKIRFTRVE